MKNGLTNISFKVDGMHCKSCEMLIKDEIESIKGVNKVVVDHKTGEGTIIAKKNIENDLILKAIESAGYQGSIEHNDSKKKSNGNGTSTAQVIYDGVLLKSILSSGLSIKGSVKKDEEGGIQFDGTIALNDNSKNINKVTDYQIPTSISQNEECKVSPIADTSQKKISLSLFGMHCSSCAGVIEKSLKKVPGVLEARVNFAAEKAVVVYDPANTKEEDLIKAVEKTGYKATISNPANTKEDTQKQNAQINGLFKKFLWSFILSFPMIYFMLFDFFPLTS